MWSRRLIRAAWLELHGMLDDVVNGGCEEVNEERLVPKRQVPRPQGYVLVSFAVHREAVRVNMASEVVEHTLTL